MTMQGGAERKKPALRLRVLGGLSVLGPDGRALAIPNRKACAILAYLGLSASGSESRERLAGLLWSDSSEAQARASLRQCLKQLRDIFKAAGVAVFFTPRQLVQIDPGQLSFDIVEIAEGLAAGAVGDALLALEAPAEHILYGFESLDPAFTVWLHVLRQNWRDRLIDLLQLILDGAGKAPNVARRAAEALIRVDPTHERAHREIIRRHADEGNIAAALDQYKALWHLLAEDYDMEPAEETQGLIVRIKASTYARPGTPGHLLPPAGEASEDRPDSGAPVGLPRLPVIGVAPFSHGDPWTRESYFIDGFHRDLIAALVRFREWVVVEAPPGGRPANGDPVAMSYLLEGVYLEQDKDIRLVITLKDARSHRYVWSEQIVLTLETWFAAQQTIVQRLSGAMNVYMSADRLSRMAARPAVSLDLYDRWLRGQDLTLKWRPEAHAEAVTIFKSIIAESKCFGRAYSSLVQIENAAPLVHPGLHRSRERVEAALRLARQAVAVDPLDSRAQLCLGWAYAIAGHHDYAEMNLELAQHLNFNDPWTLISAALGFAFCDRLDMALRLSEQSRSKTISPTRSQWGYLGSINFLAGDYPATVRAVEMAGDALYNLSAWKAAALFHLGKITEAEQAGAHFLELARKNWTAADAASDLNIARWLLQCFPIRNRAARMKLRNGLAGAGIAVPEEPVAMLKPDH